MTEDEELQLRADGAHDDHHAEQARSLRPDVRNPIVGLKAFAKLQALPPEAKEALAAVLQEIALDARERGEKCWRTHKAPMAAYWKACSVYAGHIRRAVRSKA